MIIGITGLIGSGKDTVASIIQEYKPEYRRMSFASRLKDMTAALYHWDRQMLEGLTKEDRELREQKDGHLSLLLNQDITPRNQLQKLGAGLKELVAQNLWAMLVKDEIIREGYKNVLITDVRYPDELDMIRSLGGIILEVRRGELPNWWYLAVRKNIGFELAEEEEAILNKIHSSERSWVFINNPDHIIDNSGTLEDLRLTIKELVDDNFI